MLERIATAVFAYDGDFKKKDEKVYSAGGFPARNWNRYLSFAEKLIVLARCSDTASVGPSEVISSAPKVVFTSVPSISGPIKIIKNRYAAKKIIEKALGQADFTVVRLPSEIGLLTIDVCRKKGIPYAIELVGDVRESLSNHGGLIAKVYSNIAYLRTKRAVSSARGCIYVTRAYLQSRYPCAGITGYASNVNITLEPADDIRKIIRRKAAMRKPVFGVIGSMSTDYKGIDIAIRAIADLNSRGIVAELRVLGSGDYKRYQNLAINLNIENSIFFDGQKNSVNEVFAWLDMLTYYIQPSRTEGLPRALIEAMSRGLPAIGSDRGGIPELLNQKWVFKNLDFLALSKLMAELSTLDAASYISCGLVNYEIACNFEANVLEARRQQFWQSVLG